MTTLLQPSSIRWPGWPAAIWTRRVAVTSARNGWAVGYGKHGTLILHWNGSHWAAAHLPRTARSGALNAVATTSAGTAWAVGSLVQGEWIKTLILRWNGTEWSQAPTLISTNGGTVDLLGVTKQRQKVRESTVLCRMRIVLAGAEGSGAGYLDCLPQMPSASPTTNACTRPDPEYCSTGVSLRQEVHEFSGEMVAFAGE
jgi:hypothetical protein